MHANPGARSKSLELEKVQENEAERGKSQLLELDAELLETS